MILGIDYGAKRIGLAISDETAKISLPLKVIINNGAAAVVEEIKKIIKDEQVVKIIVGLPLNLKGEKTKKTKETQEFIDILAKKIDIPILAVDERLTSKLADVLSFKTKGSRDIGAAMIILEDYLQRQKV